MICRAHSAIILEAETHIEAKKLINKWIEGLIDKDLIIEGEVSFVENVEDDDYETNEPLTDFNGYENYPGHPL